MLGDMFDTEEEIMTGQKEGALLSTYNRQPRDCACDLPLPEMARLKGYPVGLKNQGATCYLNGLLQILFLTPQFRKLILELPLCKDDDMTKRSDYLDSESKFNFIMGFQKLFAEMQMLDCKAVSTEHLNKAFGWEKTEHLNQQDLHEAMRVILDTLERALVRTPSEHLVKESFRGMAVNYVSCLQCNGSRDTPSPYFDLMVRTKDILTLDESLQRLISPEDMTGDNKIGCDICGTRTDSLLGMRISTVPNILIVTLARFEFDMIKLDRVKIVTPLEFQLELNMAKYGVPADHPTQFQLYGVIIHQGSAHGGHYLAYVRDVMRESNWKSNLEATEAEDRKYEEEERKKRENEVLTDDQKKRREEQQKESNTKSSYSLGEVKNKELLDGWYCLNDERVTPLPASKIASQYAGTESAYILFYRRKGAPCEPPKVPSYLAKVIQQSNDNFQKIRQHYANEKQHIILRINGEEVRLNKQMKIGDLLAVYAPGGVLLNKEQHNGLDYYPVVLLPQHSDKTIEELDLLHLSNWLSLDPNAPEYVAVKDKIGKDCLPMQLNILFESKITVYETYQNTTFLQLRSYIEDKFGVPYEHQIVTLDGNRKEQKNLCETSENDDRTLLHMRIIHLSQLFVDKKQGAAEGMKKKESKKEQQLITVVVERDDEQGVKRYYVNKSILLTELLERIRATETIDEKQKRRLRWLNGDRLFYAEQYGKSLEQLNMEESLVRLRLERGEIPISGDLCVKVKLQSKLAPPTEELGEFIVDPSQQLADLKRTICIKYGLDPKEHKLYRTDWLGDPTRPITRENQTLFQSNFAAEETLCLRDNASPTDQELIHFNISITKTGSPEDCTDAKISLKCEETATLAQLKEKILDVPAIKELAGGKNYKHLRVRELKRDYMFGAVLREHDKSLKTNNITDCNLVVQLLDHEQQLGEDDIVLIVKERDSENKKYKQGEEFIFRAGKVPKVVDLKRALLVWKEMELPPEELRIAKYYHNDFEWIQFTEDNFKKWLEARIKKRQADAKAKELNKQKNKKSGKEKEAKKEPKQNKAVEQTKTANENPTSVDVGKGEKQITQPTNDVPPQTVSVAPPTNKPAQHPKSKKERNQADKEGQPKEEHKEKKAKVNKPEQLPAKEYVEEQNLRKVPFLLKDGDIVGYGYSCEILEADDFQTEEDEYLRRVKEMELGKTSGGKKNRKENPFELFVDF